VNPPSTPHTDDPAVVVLIERVDNLRTDVASLRDLVVQQQAGYVSRREFDAWRAGVAQEITDLKSRRAPWWSVGAVLVAGAALLSQLIPALAK